MIWLCLAVPGKVVEVDYPFAVVDFKGARRKVRIDLLDDVKAGDYVLVHVGFAIQKVEKSEAEEIESFLEQLAC